MREKAVEERLLGGPWLAVLLVFVVNKLISACDALGLLKKNNTYEFFAVYFPKKPTDDALLYNTDTQKLPSKKSIEKKNKAKKNNCNSFV